MVMIKNKTTEFLLKKKIKKPFLSVNLPHEKYILQKVPQLLQLKKQNRQFCIKFLISYAVSDYKKS